MGATYHGLDEFSIDVIPYLEQVSLLLGGGHVGSHSRRIYRYKKYNGRKIEL
jgi:hypothetical protein